jgi:opacity protein-like surface antigen
MRNRYLLGAGVALAVAMSWANAQAQLLAMPSGPGAWYFGGEGGWTTLEDQTGTLLGVPIRQNFNDGFNVGARAGYEWGPWRFEEEFRFQQNSDTSFGFGPFTRKANGDRNAYAFMSNAIYDFTLGWPITPHIGAGIGVVGLRDGVGIAGIGSFANSTDWEFGYQGIAGVRYNINPALAFDVDYRYLATTDPTFHSKFGGAAYTSGYSTHSILASLSLRFGAPPPMAAAPPMPPAPPMMARKVFLVFFDWDRDTITPEGMQIVQQAAAAFRAGGPVTIQVTGYTDRSGSPGYNQRLSERRANNVANAMVRLGVPRQAMAVGGRGENDNRVPTADGVREPQNRRVEIVFP